MSALPLADGPAMYLGGSIISFAVPMGLIIVIGGVLFYLYRRPHHNPQLKYMAPETVTSVETREPGPVPAPAPKAAADAVPETAARQTAVPETVAPEVADSGVKAGTEAIDSAQEEQEEKE